jgi:hypothetical protein
MLKKRIKKTGRNVNKQQKIDDWESDYYESFKNSESESDDSEDKESKNKVDTLNEAPRISTRKKNALNFKKKILKSEKKSNLLKLNCNLRQLIYDEFDSQSKSDLYNNYLNCTRGRQRVKRLRICTICLGFNRLCKCSICSSQICQKCFHVHSELGCGLNF